MTKDPVILDGSKNFIPLDETGYQLSAPGLSGTVEAMRRKLLLKKGGPAPVDPFLDDELAVVFHNQGFDIEEVFEIDIKSDTTLLSKSASSSQPAPDLRLRVPLTEGRSNIILYSDEDGTARWIFPQLTKSAKDELFFSLPRHSMQANLPKGSLGGIFKIIPKIGKRIVRVISWVTTPIIGKAAEFVFDKIERKKYALFPLSSDTKKSQRWMSNEDWSHIASGTALLLIHGTFGTTAKSYRHFLNTLEFNELLASYENRVFAFDHASVSKTPIENVDWFLDKLPPNLDLNLNILTTSRGGLIARDFIHRATDLRQKGWNLSIDNLVMLSCPNRGTIIAEPDSIPELIDRLTNLLNVFPDNPATTIIDGVISVVKILARGIIAGLPGISDQSPNSDFIRTLNKRVMPPATQLHAISASFEPGHFKLRNLHKHWIDNGLDKVFKEANDAVVPTGGVSDFLIPQAGHPVQLHSSVEGDVHHLTYFLERKIREQTRDWLLLPKPAL